MPVNFFEKELGKVRSRFNMILGESIVCDLKVRQTLILAICWMGVLKQKIDKPKDKEVVRDEIKKFVRYRDLVNIIFDKLEIELQERRGDGNSDDATERNGKANTARSAGNLPAV